MNKIVTPSFTLAVYQKGRNNASKLALVLPGRLDTKDYPHMRSHVDFLAQKGYLALSFDPPGTWESSGGIEVYTMTNYLKAINEIIEYFGNKPTLLLGHSRGGSMALLAGTTNPQVTHFVAIMSRLSASVPENLSAQEEISYRDIPNDPQKQKKFELPMNYFKDAARYDMTEDLKRSTKPKLFILGTKDEVIKPESVRAMYKLAAEPKQLCELNSDHDYRKHPAVIEKVDQAVDDFLKEFK